MGWVETFSLVLKIYIQLDCFYFHQYLIKLFNLNRESDQVMLF